MDKVLTNAQMRAADFYTINELKIPASELMRRAGKAIADVAEEVANRENTRDILVVCGTGNNGGDGYACANELLRRSFNVKIYAADGELSPECQREKFANKCGYLRHMWGSIVIDCLFGAGLNRPICGEYQKIISEINAYKAYKISADIPSGINGDNGLACGCAVKADLTVAVQEYKAGHFLNDGLDYCGVVVKKDIGIQCINDTSAKILKDSDAAAYFPARLRNTHKGSYGSACLVAGSEKYIGAAALSLRAALSSGCGIVKLACAEKLKFALAPVIPQAIYIDQCDLTCKAISVGSGCGESEELYDKITYLLKNYKGTLIIDADGLNALSLYGADVLKEKQCAVIITPHLKEFSRLTNLSVEEIASNPLTLAKEFAANYGVTVLLKSASSVITDGDRAVINTTGTTALSKGGSGDILAGYLCGSVARGLSPFDGAVCAAYVLGRAAEISSDEKTDFCATAEDVIKNLHFAVKRLTEK